MTKEAGIYSRIEKLGQENNGLLKLILEKLETGTPVVPVNQDTAKVQQAVPDAPKKPTKSKDDTPMSRDDFLILVQNAVHGIRGGLIFIHSIMEFNQALYCEGDTQCKKKLERSQEVIYEFDRYTVGKLQHRIFDGTHPLGYPMVKDFEEYLEYYREIIQGNREFFESLDSVQVQILDIITNMVADLIEQGKNY